MRTKHPECASVPAIVTGSQSFFRYSVSRPTATSDAFVVKAGAPANDALQLASVFLAAAADLADFYGSDEVLSRTNAAFAPAYLIEFAKALIDSIVIPSPDRD